MLTVTLMRSWMEVSSGSGLSERQSWGRPTFAQWPNLAQNPNWPAMWRRS